ncbi:hypothetical protein HRbin27_01091 [bacterium HR27]|nr:hypothetical protein HRbin27_01091 [bacterium HR27]
MLECVDVQEQRQRGRSSPLEQARLERAESRRRPPVDLPRRVARLVGTDTLDAERIVQERTERRRIAERALGRKAEGVDRPDLRVDEQRRARFHIEAGTRQTEGVARGQLRWAEPKDAATHSPAGIAADDPFRSADRQQRAQHFALRLG